MNVLQQQVDIRTQIRDHIAAKGIKKTWLAEQIPCSLTHLSHILECDRPLTKKNLAKINAALETDFKENEAPTSAS
jgi:hypothetical protein